MEQEVELVCEQRFETTVAPKNKLFDLKLKELWAYRDLIWLFVKRDFVTLYKQTILGPAWAIIQPLLTTVVFTLVFGNIAGFQPAPGVPQFLFYMIATITWTLFSSCLTTVSGTFVSNSHVFGKVYFPRLAVPVSTAIGKLIGFGIQFLFFMVFWGVLQFDASYNYAMNWWVLLVPVLLVEVMILGTGFGIIISSLTTKYRDLMMLVGFGVQLWMYITPVAYSLAEIEEAFPALSWVFLINPMTPIIEVMRYAFFDSYTEASVSMSQVLAYLGVSGVVSVLILIVGVIMFNRIEKTFMDTV